MKQTQPIPRYLICLLFSLLMCSTVVMAKAAPTSATLNILYKSEDGKTLGTDTQTDLPFGNHIIHAKSFIGYTPQNESLSVALSQSEATKTVTFVYSPVQLGNVQVSYITTTGTILASDTLRGLKLGTHRIEAKTFTGYNVQTPFQNITITEATLTQNVTFVYDKDLSGTVTIYYVDLNGIILGQQVKSNLEFGRHTFLARVFKGYIATTPEKTITITDANSVQDITFVYTVRVTGNVTIQCVDENGIVIKTTVEKDYDSGSHTIKAPQIPGYTAIQSSQNVVISSSELNPTITFGYKASDYGKVNIVCIDKNGVQIGSSVVKELAMGNHKIKAPTIAGYTPIEQEYTVAITSSNLTPTIYIPYSKGSTGNQNKVTIYIDKNIWYLNDVLQNTKLDVAPVAYKGRTYVPIRFLSTALNIKEQNIGWDSTTQTVKITDQNTTIEVKLGSNIAKMNGKSVTMDGTPYFSDSRVLLPVSQIVPLFKHKGVTMEWNQTEKRVDIFYNKK